MSDKFPGGMITANAPAGFSVAFNGSSDYLTVPDNAAWDLSGDFTLELWAYLNNYTSTGASPTFISGTNSSNNWLLFVTSSNEVIFLFNTGTVLNGTATSTTNEWAHYALCRSGSTIRLFKNGVLLTSATNSTNFTITNSVLYLGVQNGSNGFINGYMSNVRLVNGTALYTANFTPSTQLFPVPNTVFLACQSPTIIDNSTNAFPITAVSGAKVSNFTPFAAYTGFNPALGAAAGGVWTLDEAAYYQNNRQWPIYDPYFNNTTLMLHGNGTNGAQNNTFLDSSTNNFTITRNGNTTQGSFSPFSQTGWSYNGTAGAYCTLNNADYSLGTGDFTVETWMYCVDDSTYSYANICSAPSNPNFTVGFGAGGGSGARQLYVEYGGSATGIGNNMSGYLNRWTHIAVVRQSGTVTAYQNGVSLGSISKSASVGSTANLYLLRNTGDTGMDFRGYISNYRITKSAVYTSNFTPSTAPLTAVTSTVLLTFQDNRFVDNSANNSTVTPAGTASVQSFSPFVPAYITPTTYSNWFDGSGDYLTAPNAAWMNLGTGDFTMECWVQFNSVSSTQMFVSNNYNAGTGGGGWAFLYRQDNTTLKFSCNSNVSYEKTWSPAVGTMYHVAVCRSGTDLRLFVNGVQLGTTSTSSDNISGASSTLDVGTNLGGTPLPINGVISNMRIVTSALYTASFTPPTAPLTAVTNTQLLTCQSSTFIDNSANAATLTANGNVQPVTSPTPFPAKVDTTTLNSAYSTSLIGGSGYFDGTGDYLSIPANAGFQFDGDFTVECWFYSGSGTTTSKFDQIVGTIVDATTGYWRIGSEFNGGKQLWFTWTNGSFNDILTSFSVSDNAWHHLAVTRISNSVRLFVDGIQRGSTTTVTTNLTASAPLMIMNSTQGSNQTQGYVGSLRIIKGQGIYNAAFSPQRTPFTAISGTTVLLNFTNAGIYDNTAKNVVETVGNAQISTTQSKWGGSSMYFDGTGDYLLLPNTPTLALGSGNFTVECWWYPTDLSATTNLWCLGDERSSYNGLLLYWSSGSGSLILYSNGSPIITSSILTPINSWHFVSVVRNGTTITLYVNGVSAGTVTNSTLFTGVAANGLCINAEYAGSFTAGKAAYYDDFRITRGYARYTTNFTPPTSQLQDQ